MVKKEKPFFIWSEAGHEGYILDIPKALRVQECTDSGVEAKPEVSYMVT